MELLERLLDIISLTWILIALALVLAYFYLTWTFNTWSKQGVKGDRPLPLFGTMLSAMSAGGFAQYDKKQMDKHGKISGCVCFEFCLCHVIGAVLQLGLSHLHPD